ncbi:hypothetical protein ZBT109_2254 [Zymobacter palmae]|uniref:Uncharacterized protein n=1 Tax=Zymobacter palmae TaxID=33074 RepID=A0A348HH84_9GAMM|nr:hypothetical protein ZBT109_2254 [Zymobacter palmae]
MIFLLLPGLFFDMLSKILKSRSCITAARLAH